MAYIVADRIQETTATTGTGTLTLGGAVTGFRAFSTIGDGNTCPYLITDGGANWEVGIGTYTLSGTTLARTTILSSSNSGSAVSFAAGTKNVLLTLPSSEAVLNSMSGNYPTIKPSLLLDFANTRTLDPRITFTRASTGSYYDGSTVMAEQNLLTYSQDSSNAIWAVTNTTKAISGTAPDGTSTATLVTASSGNAQHILANSGATSCVIGLTYTISVYAKTGAYNLMQVAPGSAPAGTYANFDLTAGTVVSGSAATGTITSAGNGWYRCTVTFTANSVGNNYSAFSFVTSTSATYLASYNAAGTETIYVWGAQLEQRSTALVYTATTTAAITNYIPVLKTAAANVPRFDVNPTTGESLGLLIEESRTNGILYSQAFDNAAWTKTRSSITTLADIAPDGTLTAQKLVEDSTATNTHFVTQSMTTTAVAMTASVYAKAKERTFIYISITDSGSVVRSVYFNLSTGAIGTTGTGVTASTISVGNGWYRCVATIGTALAGSNPIVIGLASADNSPSYSGDGFSGAIIWGAQVE